MFEGLDAVDWAGLSHAYGGAEDTPGLLRLACSEDGETVSRALSELHGSLFHQGTVCPATTAAVPFLAELASAASCHRDQFVWTLGMLADDRHTDGADVPAVRAAIVARRELFEDLLDDPDPLVREAAAYAAARAGVDGEPLWARWAVEDHPAARATLALALGERDTMTAEPVLRDMALTGEPEVRVAAAVALLRAGSPWPTGTVPALVTAIDHDATITWAWARGAEWSEEIVVAPPTGVAVEVAKHLLRSDEPSTRRSGLWAIGERCEVSRSAPAVFTPLVVSLLHDPDPDVRHSAMDLLRRAGAAAGRFADVVADVASRFPGPAGQGGFTVEYQAVETLVRLGDPRWVAPVRAAADRGDQFHFAPGAVRHTPEVLTAVRDHLAAQPGFARVLAPMVVFWGAAAAVLVPDLIAAMDHAGPQVAQTLLALGHDDATAVPHWRAQAARGDVAAALAVRRMTGDDTVVLDALHTILSGRAPAPWAPATGLGDLGDALTPSLPDTTRYLTGVAEPIHPDRTRQVLAARVTAAVSGPQIVLPTVRAVLAAGDTPARHAADLVADLATTAPATVAQLRPELRDRLGDPWSRLAAARALARLGTPTAELTEPLCSGITDYGGRFGPTTILELRAVETIPTLEDLLHHDQRSGATGFHDDIVWADELFQELLKATIDGLRDLWGTVPSTPIQELRRSTQPNLTGREQA